LAGTEVLPIVQSGTTVKATVANITGAGAYAGSFTTLSATGVTTVQAGTALLPAITTSGDTNTGIWFPAADTIAFTEGGAESMRITSAGNVGIGVTAPSSKLQVSDSTNGGAVEITVANTYYLATSTDETVAFQGEFFQNDLATNRAAGYMQIGKSGDFSNAANASGFMAFATRNAGTIAEKMRITSTGGVNLGATTDPGAGNLSLTGNVVIGTSGKGIDFSATAGSGTSELLADYEEGYFDPTLTCGTSGTITLNAAENRLAYTKIGRVVYISGQFAISSVSSPVGTVTMNNLPFAVASLDERSESAIFNVVLSNTTLNTPTFFGLITTAGATTLLIRAKDNVGAINSSPASLFAASDVWISGYYIAA
jgi:hypothetical protein